MLFGGQLRPRRRKATDLPAAWGSGERRELLGGKRLLCNLELKTVGILGAMGPLVPPNLPMLVMMWQFDVDRTLEVRAAKK